MNKFTEGHLLVVVRIDDSQKIVDLFIIVNDVHLRNEVSELIFVDDSIIVIVYCFEDNDEFLKELLMFLQLEIKNDLLELKEWKLFVVSRVFLHNLLFSCKFLGITKGFIVRSSFLVLNDLNELLFKNFIVIRVVHLFNN